MMTPTEFVELCSQLRAMGATRVATADFDAHFAGAAVVQPKPEAAAVRELPWTPEASRAAMLKAVLDV